MADYLPFLILILAFGVSLVPAVERVLNTWPAFAIALVLTIYVVYSAIEIHNGITFPNVVLVIIFVYGLSKRFISIRAEQSHPNP